MRRHRSGLLTGHRGAWEVFLWLGLCLWAGLGAEMVHAEDQAPSPWGAWTAWGDLGDGTYRNPVIPADYSDLDCIRVGEAYYAISSTMQFSPGMTVLRSPDLVNWSIIGHAVSDLTQIGPELNWDRMNRYGRGVWAGSIRYHAGTFLVLFGTPDEGFFLTTATDPAGPWAPLTPLLTEAGWDDCSALWDADGQAWFVGTQFMEGGEHVYNTYLFRMPPDGSAIDRESAVLINQGGHREANKLIRVNDWYYLIYSRHIGGVGRYVCAKRAHSMSGPWSEEKPLAHPDMEARQPNQGGIVEGPDGKWYFFTHHGSGDWEGRAASLLPVTWIDGWPIIGEVQADGRGAMVWGGAKPLPETPRIPPQTSDEFEGPRLGPQWQWNYQPRAEFWSLTERPGWLRLRAFPPLRPNDLKQVGNILTQRSYRTPANQVVIRLDVSGMVDGQEAGLCHFSMPQSALGVRQQGAARSLVYRKDGELTPGPTVGRDHLWLKSSWGSDGKSWYAFSLDGEVFIPFGEPYPLAWGHYRGDRIGIYTFHDHAEAGQIDVDFLRYAMGPGQDLGGIDDEGYPGDQILGRRNGVLRGGSVH